MPPDPPDGFDSWIEYCLEMLQRFDYIGAWSEKVGYAREELAELRKAANDDETGS